MNICVFGASSNLVDAHYVRAVEALGEAMAARGHSLVYGGSAQGLMGAIARGANRAGGRILGIVPTFFRNVDGKVYDGCTELCYAETMRDRKQIMEERSEAIIMVPGGIGTFDEFFAILTLKQLARHNKPIAIYNINNYFDPMQKMLEAVVEQKFMPAANLELYRCFTDRDALLTYVETYKEAGKSVQELKHI